MIESFEVIYACGNALALESKYKIIQDLDGRFIAYNPSAAMVYSVFDNHQHFLEHLESIEPAARTYHEVILDVPQKLKFDIDADMEKFSMGSIAENSTDSSVDNSTDNVDNNAANTTNIEPATQDDLDILIGELFTDVPEKHADDNSAEPHTLEYNDVFGTILKAIRDAFFVTYGYDISRENEIITASHGPNKFSNHIILDGVYVSNASQAREFTKTVGSFLTPYYRKFLDLGVNKRLQNFRAPGCHKSGTTRTKKIITNHTPAQCLITNVSGQLLPDIATETPRQECGDMCEVVEICKKDVELRTHHMYRYYRRGEFLFNRIKPSFCNFCLRTHLSDNTAYVVLVPSGTGYSVRRQCRRYISEQGADGNHFVIIGEIVNNGVVNSSNGIIATTTTDTTNPPITVPIITYCDNICNKVICDIAAGKIPPRPPLHAGMVYHEPTLRPFLSARTLVVHAQMKMGKTKALRNFIDANFAPGIVSPHIRFISFRQTFSSNIKEKFPEFTLYSDIKGMLSADRLIVQVESLHRIAITSDPPDLLILDECESIFEQFDSGLLGGNFNECFAVFQYLLKYSRSCILMDANISDRTFRILAKMRPGDIAYHHNTWQVNRDDKYFVCGDKIRWLGAMYESIDNGEKIALCTNSLTEAKTIFAACVRKYPNKTVRMYSSETLESEKREHFGDVNTHWLVDILIYTPTVSAGVSFEKKHFDRMFGYFTDQSCAVETCQQMIGRVRDVATKNYHICLTGTSNNLPINPAAIADALQSKRDRLAMQVNESGLRFEFGPTGELIHHAGDYFHIWVENTRIRNLSKNSFIRRFITHIHHTGASIFMQAECGDADRIRAVHAATREEIKVEQAKNISTATEIDAEVAGEIQSLIIARKDLSDEQRFSYEKFRLRRDYKYGGNITPKFVMKYHKKSTRRIYKNITRLRSYPTMEEAWKQIQNEEHAVHSYLMNDGKDSSQQSDLRRKYVFDQHRYAGGLLKMLGWKHIDDPAYFHRITIDANIANGNYHEIIREACHEFELKSPPPTTDTGMIIKNINKILSIMYGIRVVSKSSSPDMFYLKQNTMFTDDAKVSAVKNRPLIGGNLDATVGGVGILTPTVFTASTSIACNADTCLLDI